MPDLPVLSILFDLGLMRCRGVNGTRMEPDAILLDYRWSRLLAGKSGHLTEGRTAARPLFFASLGGPAVIMKQFSMSALPPKADINRHG